MYRYDEFDARLVSERVRQFRGQVARRLSGELTEEQFRPLRLMNGLYLQLHAYMLRVAVPYGTLSSTQMRRLARIARVYDRGYGHFTTRQNIQYNWPRLVDTPDILEELAEVGMHAIQTSGNCIRNVTADHYAGATDEEIEDPRITAEIIRQWSTLHPEFSFLPRKFKIAVTAAPRDRAALRLHDIGVEIVRGPAGETGARVFAGGGQGRTPVIAITVRDFVPKAELLTFLEAIMRVYNEAGRRDNIHKARIKILVGQMGAEAFRAAVEAEYEQLRREAPVVLPPEELARIAAFFAPSPFEAFDDPDTEFERALAADAEFALWAETNVARHKARGYAIATISLKPVGGVPGDATAEQMEAVADLADAHSFGEIRISHEQNLVLPHAPRKDLYALWRALREHGLAAANHGLITDIVACPGLDYCNLANARSIPVAQAIGERFAGPERQKLIGELKIRISGCINACGHHHAGHIGILGVDKKGTEYYQITLGGSSDETASLGEVAGPAFPAEEVPDAIERLVEAYLSQRAAGERFLDTCRRIGLAPFREALYPSREGIRGGPLMALIKNGEIIIDAWRHLPDDAPAPEGAGVIVSLERWTREREALLARGGRLGVRLRPDQPPRLIADDLGRFALVALEFPAFKDGRAYSHARVLRERYGFRGEVRAVGEVLRDQLPFMARCGFDAFEAADGLTPEAWREALAEISVVFQRTGDGRRTVWELRRGA